MKKLSMIWLGVIIFLSFQFLSAYSSEVKPSVRAVNEETGGCNCRGDLDRNGVINPVDLEYMAKVIRHEIVPDPSLVACADLDYNGLSWEMSDYAVLENWMSPYHVILCGKEELTLASLKVSKVKARPGETFTLPVLIKNYITVGGIDLQIEFDPTLLYLKGVERGAALAIKDSTGSYQWEYFGYRRIPNTGSDIYRLEIVALYDIKNAHKGVPLPPVSDFEELAVIKFQVPFDNNLLGSEVPVNFYWNPNDCSENSMSDQTGNILYVSNDSLQFNFTDCDTNNIGPGNRVVTSLHFENGEVEIEGPPGAQIGDINLNGVPYEIGDATLFANCLVYGLSVLTIDRFRQIAVSDIDRDRVFLTLSDFLLLVRIMQGKAVPGDSTGVSDKVVYFNPSIKDSSLLISLNSEIPIGAAYLSFYYFNPLGIPYIASTNMDLLYKADNNILTVLIYSFKDGVNIPAGPVGLLVIPGYRETEFVHLEAVDDKGRVLKVKREATGISDQPAQDLPKSFALLPNYPNPFNPETYIEYTLPADCQVTLAVYNVLGQKVKTLINEHQPAGLKSVRWDGKDDSGNQVSAGVYFYSIKADNFTQAKKMILLK